MKLTSAAILMSSSFVFTLSQSSAALAQAGPAKPQAIPSQPEIALTLTDLTPKFITFYAAAEREHASPERRWELWKQMYDFAAVPPTPEGDALARKLLDRAWPRYPSVLPQIRAGAGAMTPKPDATLHAVAGLLQPENPVSVRLLVFVGAFEDNAFTAAQDGRITTALPIEMKAELRALIMTHELAHAVHIAMGSFSGGWQRTIGTTVLTEGLAMRVTQRLFPGRSAKDFVEMTPGWLAKANAQRREILTGIRPFLESDRNEDVMRFTMGAGPQGLEREAYYVGWEVVGYWLAHGMEFAAIARIPEKEMPKRVSDAIDALLEATP